MDVDCVDLHRPTLRFPSSFGTLVSWLSRMFSDLSAVSRPSSAGTLVNLFLGRYSSTSAVRFPSSAGKLVSWFPPSRAWRILLAQQVTGCLAAV